MSIESLYSRIPKVDDFLNDSDFTDKLSTVPRPLILRGIRDELDNIRDMIKSGCEEDKVVKKISSLKSDIIERVNSLNEYKLRRVINATGVVIHTNLGRAAVSESVMKHISEIATHYSNLEYDLKEGKRGSRYSALVDVIKDITGAEDALVVNNNAAAVMLALGTIAHGKEVILSRGEMVEIGGSFRIPDVMEASGATLVAVGTTNKTHYSDYEKAITEDTAALLKVHTSNYRILGFTESVDAEELKPLKEKYDIPIIEDLGSGVLIDLSEYGLEKEPTVQESVKKGIDIITFSGDKLLGSSQAGIIIGKKKYIDLMKKNPLTRALRIDKFTISCLEATLKEFYEPEKAVENIPTLRMIIEKQPAVKKRAKKLFSKLKDIENINVSIEECFSEVGGGSLPLEKLPSFAVSAVPEKISIDKFEKALRRFNPPIVIRISEDKAMFDCRTILDDEFDLIASGVKSALQSQ